MNLTSDPSEADQHPDAADLASAAETPEAVDADAPESTEAVEAAVLGESGEETAAESVLVPEPAPTAREMLLGENARSVALEALGEITQPEDIGEAVGYRIDQQDVVSLFFASALPGYPHWVWVATLTTLDGEELSVLEVQLQPTEEALLAPEWVPWADRLAEYKLELAEEEAELKRAAAEAKAAKKAESEGDSDDDDDPDALDDSDDDDEDDFDDDDLDDHDDDFDFDDDDEDDEDDDILSAHFDHELRGELPLQLEEIVDDLELDED